MLVQEVTFTGGWFQSKVPLRSLGPWVSSWRAAGMLTANPCSRSPGPAQWGPTSLLPPVLLWGLQVATGPSPGWASRTVSRPQRSPPVGEGARMKRLISEALASSTTSHLPRGPQEPRLPAHSSWMNCFPVRTPKSADFRNSYKFCGHRTNGFITSVRPSIFLKCENRVIFKLKVEASSPADRRSLAGFPVLWARSRWSMFLSSMSFSPSPLLCL